MKTLKKIALRLLLVLAAFVTAKMTAPDLPDSWAHAVMVLALAATAPLIDPEFFNRTFKRTFNVWREPVA